MIGPFRGKYRWLSNFWTVPGRVSLDGMSFPTVEHAYVAAKTTDIGARRYIQEHCKTPGDAKRYGHGLKLRENWDESYFDDKALRLPLKLAIMHDLLTQKFRNPGLREQLLATGKEELVEINTWHDNYWGNCTCSRCADKPGENFLGKMLMADRAEAGGDTGMTCKIESCNKPAKMLLYEGNTLTPCCDRCNAALDLGAKKCSCWDCWQRPTCQFAWDAYNIDGDCIANK